MSRRSRSTAPTPAGLVSGRHDALRPTADQALDAWTARVRADREQVERSREVADPADFYAPVAERFRLDPRRTDDPTLEVLRSLARPDDTWLDIGAGGGRFALPLALLVREVVALEPSAGMLTVLRGGMRDAGIRNVRIVEARWPASDARSPAGRGDAGGSRAVAGEAAPAKGSASDAAAVAGDGLRAHVTLMAHVGYDIEAIGPFLDAAERAATRLCVAVMGQAAMTTVATLFWRPIHGEPRVALPALPELVTLLLARGRLPEVRLVGRAAPTFDSFDALLAMARRQLWVRPGSDKDRELERLVRERAVERERRWSLDDQPARIGIVTWSPVA